MSASNLPARGALFNRQVCLNLLGVKQWYSRFNLSNAAKTPAALFAKADIDTNLSRPNTVFPEADQSSAKRLPKQVIDSAGLLKSPEKISVSSLLVEEQANDIDEAQLQESVVSNDVSLSLNMMSFEKGLIFYEGQASESQLKEQRLLKAFIKFALSGVGEHFESSFFQWPVFSSSVLRKNQNRYLNDSVSRWANQANWSSAQYVFYFGHQFNLLEKEFLDLKLSSESACIFVPIQLSIAELLSAPIKKRALWDCISSLPERR